MNIADKLTTIAENQEKVFEAGKKSQYDEFWDIYQNYGNYTAYSYAFANNRFDENTYNPKYRIYCIISSSGSILTNTFSSNTKIKDTKVPILAGTSNENKQCTLNNTFIDCTNLETIRELYLIRTVISQYCFSRCTSLKNLTITGEIIQNAWFSTCPLSLESAKSVMYHLTDYSGTEYNGTYTVYFSSTTLGYLDNDENVLTSLEELGVDTTTITTWRDYIESKGWNC